MRKCRNCGGSPVKKPPVKTKPSISSKITTIIGKKNVAGGKSTKI